MSFCKQSGDDGKDKVVFVTKEEYYEPINTRLADVEVDEEAGLINADGGINWGCPCLGGMATGPCGQEFREAFSCFHYSESEMKGQECVDSFRKMSECMAQYPDLYPENKDDDDEEGEAIMSTKDPQSDSKGSTEDKTESKSS